MKKYEHAFGKNDIRGIYGEDITEELYFKTGRGFVNWLKKQSGKKESDMWITITRDARLHSPALEKALTEGITSTGANVIHLGLAPTPIGYYSEVVGIPGYEVIAAAIITASHNPKEYNGLKMTYQKRTLTEAQIAEVKDYTFKEFEKTEDLTTTKGKVTDYNIIPDYIKDMENRFGKIGEGVKIVVDSANATGGVVGPELYKKLGCDIIELFSTPDGNFPNHHPNPSVEKTLDTLKEVVVENKADVGIAYDGDSDRIGIIDQDGKFLTGDKLLLIYAMDLIEDCKQTGTCPTVVSEVKCSQPSFLYRIIEIIAKHKKVNPNFKISDMLKSFDEVCSSPEVRFPCPNERKKEVLEKFKQCVESNKNMFGSEIKEIITLDGMRIVFDGGFALIRQSNTEPVFTLRFEAKNKEECEQFKSCMINTLENILKKEFKIK